MDFSIVRQFRDSENLGNQPLEAAARVNRQYVQSNDFMNKVQRLQDFRAATRQRGHH